MGDKPLVKSFSGFRVDDYANNDVLRIFPFIPPNPDVKGSIRVPLHTYILTYTCNTLLLEMYTFIDLQKTAHLTLCLQHPAKKSGF